MTTYDRGNAESHRGRRPRAAALLLFLVGLALTGLSTWLQWRANTERVAQELDALAEEATDSLFERLRVHEYGLRGLRGSVLSTGRDGVSRRQIRAYAESRDNDAEFPGAHGFGFIRRVPAAQEATFLAAARRDGMPEFALRQLQPSDHERYVIQYIEPVEHNRPALGLDIASEANRRAAADLALRTGQVAITRPITLVQAPGERKQGFLVLLAVYQPGLPLSSEAERDAAAFGWTYAPLVIDEVLASFDFRGGAFTLSLFDVGEGEEWPREQFYGPAAPAQPDDERLVRRITRPIFGRSWQVELRAQPPFLERLNLLPPGTVFAAGALLSALLAALLNAYLLSRDRQNQLIAGQLRLATIIEHSSDAIIVETLDGVITSWNGAAERIFGYRADEAIGRSTDALLPPVTSDRSSESMRMSVRHGGAVDPFDHVCRHRDGSRVEVSITASPITAPDGRVIGMGKTIRDISARKEAERQLQEFNTRLERQVHERTAQLETASRDLHTILNALPSMIGYWDARLTCRFANQAYHDWFGVEPKSLPGRHIRELLGEQLYTANRPYIEGALRGEAQVFERSIPRPDGQGFRHSLSHYLPDVVDGEVRGFYVLVHDVTDLTENRQKLAAAIRDNEALLRTIQSNVLYSVSDRDGTILDVNEVMCRTSGYRRDELIGKNHRIFSSGAHSPAFWAEMWATIGSGRPWRGELCDRRKDGELFWSDTVIAPFFADSGVIERYVAIRTDITASKIAGRELARERQRLDNILRGTDVGTWEWNVQTGEARFNARWAEHIGYTLAQLAPVSIDTWQAHTHPDDLALAQELLKRHFHGELEQYECECRVRHRDGHWVWVLDRGRVSTRTAEGAPEWMHGTRQDISRSKEAQRRLAASEVFLERAGELARVGGWQLEIESGELTWTSETRRIHDLPPGYGPTLERAVEFYAPEARPMIRAALNETIARGGTFDIELPIITAAGRPIWVRAIGEAEYAEGDRSRPLRLLGAVQDITARRAADDALRAAKGAAEAASAAKSMFLANMSHEIRTPLNAIIGLTYLLDRSALDAEQRRFITTLQIAGRALLGIVNDVLDLAKIEAGNIVLDLAPFGLRAMLDELAAVFGPQAHARHLALAFDVPPDLPAVVNGDATRVRQLLTNLLGNAIKFTERGSVRLSVTFTRDSADRIRACFAVRDTGIGIAPEALQRIFTPFEQADASTTRRFGGTGLGLSIVRHVVDLMGGEVGAESVLGEGSEFRVVLPLELPVRRAEDPGRAPTAAPVEQTQRLADVRILVVDDNEFNREIAQCILASEGALVTTHGNGQEALDQLRATPDAFELVLMDVQMPGMDGNEATSRIRGELGLTELPVIALTAGALVGERQRAFDAGMSDFVSKPLDPDTLVRLVRRHVDERRRSRTRRPLAAPLRSEG
jgi:hypothetical protein